MHSLRPWLCSFPGAVLPAASCGDFYAAHCGFAFFAGVRFSHIFIHAICRLVKKIKITRKPCVTWGPCGFCFLSALSCSSHQLNLLLQHLPSCAALAVEPADGAARSLALHWEAVGPVTRQHWDGPDLVRWGKPSPYPCAWQFSCSVVPPQTISYVDMVLICG